MKLASLSSKVWLFIFITIVVMVTLMTLFSITYSKYITVNVLATNKGLTKFERASNYSIYIFNIMTNQGNVSLKSKTFKYDYAHN